MVNSLPHLWVNKDEQLVYNWYCINCLYMLLIQCAVKNVIWINLRLGQWSVTLISWSVSYIFNYHSHINKKHPFYVLLFSYFLSGTGRMFPTLAHSIHFLTSQMAEMQSLILSITEKYKALIMMYVNNM